MTDDLKPDGKTARTLVGRTLDHYRVTAAIGQGGMGVVYRAEDTRLGREVALKVLPEAVAGDEERRRRFIREARAAAVVDHANIATVYDVGEAEGCVYLAMELVDGTTLRERLAVGPLDPPEATHVARQSRSASPAPTSAASCIATSSPTTSWSRATAA